MNLGHLAFVSRDIEKTKKFYVDGLGFKVQFEMRNKDGSLAILYIKVNEREFIEFFPTSGEIPNGGAYRHLCLHTDDMQAELKAITSRGITPDGEVRQGNDGNYQLWLTDPDGNRIELMQLMPNAPQIRVSDELIVVTKKS